MIGQLLQGKYRVAEQLGEGGMGIVYRALHEGLQHPVAVKVLRHELAEQPEVSERFMREARILARLDSDHIVRILDIGRVGAAPYIVMEYLEGEDLQTRVERTGPLSLVDIIEVALQALSGLSVAHRQGVVHRDLKPENLYLARSGRGLETVKIVDFGISKSMAAGFGKLTQPQVAIGSPYYMSPEQLLAHEHLDARADIWSMGVVLYQLATGWMPFMGKSTAEVCGRVLHRQPLAPSQLVPGLPAAFDALVASCLEKAPESRPGSADALAQLLRTCLATGSQQVSLDAPATLGSEQRRFSLGIHGSNPSASRLRTTCLTADMSNPPPSSQRQKRTTLALAGLALVTVSTLGWAASTLSTSPALPASEPQVVRHVAAASAPLSPARDAGAIAVTPTDLAAALPAKKQAVQRANTAKPKNVAHTTRAGTALPRPATLNASRPRVSPPRRGTLPDFGGRR